MMRVIIALVMPLALTSSALADESGELIRAHEQVVLSTQEYKNSLERLLPFQQAAADRAAAQVRSRREWLERGIVSRRELEDSERVWQAAMSRLEETQKRIAEADALVGETLAAIEVAKIPKSRMTTVVSTPTVIQYRGAADFAALGAGGLEHFFAARFGRPLPVSARGQTPVHDRLGLDHRHAMDVAVHPDSEEGRALMEYLREQHIPFLAFRGPIPGSSTGAHLHIGHPSARLAAATITDR